MKKPLPEEYRKMRISVPLPVWMIRRLDHEAARLGIARQAVVKTWIAERLGK